MWRRAALRSVWCSPMRSLTPKPTTSTFGNAWERRALSPPGDGRATIRSEEPLSTSVKNLHPDDQPVPTLSEGTCLLFTSHKGHLSEASIASEQSSLTQTIAIFRA